MLTYSCKQTNGKSSNAEADIKAFHSKRLKLAHIHTFLNKVDKILSPLLRVEILFLDVGPVALVEFFPYKGVFIYSHKATLHMHMTIIQLRHMTDHQCLCNNVNEDYIGVCINSYRGSSRLSLPLP